MRRPLVASACLLAVLLAVIQAVALPPDAFVAGDQGSKFLQARAFADNGPLDPGIDVLSRDVDPEYRHQEPKLKNRRGRLVSEFLWLLPLATAPFLRFFGMYGLYVVPALSAIAIFFAAASLGRRLGDPSGLWTAWFAVIATPVLFYALEYWEHAPAAACVVVAAALVAPGARSEEGGARSEEGGARRDERGARSGADRWKLAAAGGLILAGALFREEVVVALAALPIARAVSLRERRFADLVTTGLWMALGATVVFAASVPMNLLIYGAPLPMHLTQDAWEVAKATPYMQVRRDVLFDLLLPRFEALTFGVAAVAALAASIARSMRGAASASREDDDTASHVLLAIVHVSVVVMLAIAVGQPGWRIARGVPPFTAYSVQSAAHTWPFVLVVLYWPWLRHAAGAASGRFLIFSGVLTLAGAAVIVPTSGGAQWSPRFLLAAAPLLAVVAAAIVRSVWPTLTLAWPTMTSKRTAAYWMSSVVLWALGWIVVGVVVCSVAAQLEGVRFLTEAKARNAKILHRVGELTRPGDVVISDIFWVPEVLAPLSSTRRILFAWSPAEVDHTGALAARQGFRTVDVVASSAETGYFAPGVLKPEGPCAFTRRVRLAVGERGLILHRYSCGEGAVVK